MSKSQADDLCKLVSKCIELNERSADSSNDVKKFTRKTFSGIEKKIKKELELNKVCDSGEFLEDVSIDPPKLVLERHPHVTKLYIPFNNPSRWLRKLGKMFRRKDFLLGLGGLEAKKSVNDFDTGSLWEEMQNDIKTNVYPSGHNGHFVHMLPIIWFKDGAAASRGTRSITPVGRKV